MFWRKRPELDMSNMPLDSDVYFHEVRARAHARYGVQVIRQPDGGIGTCTKQAGSAVGRGPAKVPHAKHRWCGIRSTTSPETGDAAYMVDFPREPKPRKVGDEA